MFQLRVRDRCHCRWGVAGEDPWNHCAHQVAEIATSLEAMATFLVTAEAIHQIIAGIFNIACDGRHDLQELIELLALRQIAAGQGRDPFLEQCSFILGLVCQAPIDAGRGCASGWSSNSSAPDRCY